MTPLVIDLGLSSLMAHTHSYMVWVFGMVFSVAIPLSLCQVGVLERALLYDWVSSCMALMRAGRVIKAALLIERTASFLYI